jgi:hypothetical protein
MQNSNSAVENAKHHSVTKFPSRQVEPDEKAKQESTFNKNANSAATGPKHVTSM